jgi:hypothetical protein
VEFRGIEVEGMPDTKGRLGLNRKQKKPTNLLNFTFPIVALRVEGLWACDKPDYRGPAAWQRYLESIVDRIFELLPTANVLFRCLDPTESTRRAPHSSTSAQLDWNHRNGDKQQADDRAGPRWVTLRPPSP